MKKCSDCRGSMNKFRSRTPEGVEYDYFRCSKCGEEILDMKQLHAVAEEYREMKRYKAKISKWGLSLGVRIPKELVEKYHFTDDSEVVILPEEKGIRIIAP